MVARWREDVALPGSLRALLQVLQHLRHLLKEEPQAYRSFNLPRSDSQPPAYDPHRRRHRQRQSQRQRHLLLQHRFHQAALRVVVDTRTSSNTSSKQLSTRSSVMSTFQVATYILAMIRLVQVISSHALIAVRDPKIVLG